MRTIIEVWQQQADECARLAKETDDPKRRETFLKLASDWKQTIERGSHDLRGRNSTQKRLQRAGEAPRWVAVTQRRPWIRFRGWGATPLRRRTERPRGVEGCRGALAPPCKRVRKPAAPYRLVFVPTLRSIKIGA